MLNDDMMMGLTARGRTEYRLTKSLDNIRQGYMKAYDIYEETKGDNRDSVFIKDLVDCLMGIEAVVEVWSRRGGIDKDYAIEKLKWSEDIINHTIKYFENKEK